MCCTGGNNADTTVHGDDGSDTLDARGNTLTGVVLHGDADNDKLYGSPFADALYAGSGYDWIDAGAGNDTIYTQDGYADDIVNGGAGNDGLWCDAPAEAVITNVEDVYAS